jgi:hypothetical protein
MRTVFADKLDIPPIKRCLGDNCVTVGYSIIGDPSKQEEYSWIDDIMKSVASTNNMDYHQDVKKLTVGTA